MGPISSNARGFCTPKNNIAMRVPELHATQSVLQKNMMAVLVHHMPTKFKHSCAELRMNPPEDWNTALSKLIDMEADLKHNNNGKSEPAGSTNWATKYQKGYAPNGKGGKGKGKGRKNTGDNSTCYRCGKTGHWAQDCRVNLDNQKGGKKGGKSSGKGGKNKGKGGKQNNNSWYGKGNSNKRQYVHKPGKNNARNQKQRANKTVGSAQQALVSNFISQMRALNPES